MGKKRQLILGLLFSLGAIFLIAFTIDIKQSWRIIKDFDIRYLITLLALLPISYIIRTFRWWLLIRQKYNIKFSKVFEGLAIGYMCNNLLPAKLGEIIRGEYIIKNTNSSRSFIYGTVFVERLLEVFFGLLFLVLSILLSKTLFLLVKDNLIVIIGVLLIFFSIIYLYFNRTILKGLLKLIPNKRIIFIKIFSLSIIIWFGILFSVFLILHGLNITFPIQNYFFIIAGNTFGMLIPSTSGAIGVYHTVAMSILIFLNIDKETAFAYAVISHAFDFFPSIIVGLLVLAKTNYNLIQNNKQVSNTN
ncbi:MAG: flippase-like domain-containing protein [Bacteroidia bacterium]|nr:flippase-like domain-containing protein [Bacteroidia bacterium]